NNNGTTTDAIRAFNYMTMMKTRTMDPVTKQALDPVNVMVSNNSWGFNGGLDISLRDAVKRAGDAGILTVAAAGNQLVEGVDNDEDPFYPASFDDSRIISVAASDSKVQLAKFSNFGRTSVDIAAPGVDILSTEPDNS